MLTDKPIDTAQEEADEIPAAPLSGTRAQIVQRLQVGLAGLGAMVMVLGLASMVTNRANQSDEAAVPAAVPTVRPSQVSAPPIDPLAQAGVVPDIASEAAAEAQREEEERARDAAEAQQQP